MVILERALLGEKRTIVGLHVIKEVASIYDPVSNRVEMIPITQGLGKSVKSAHSAYKGHLQKQ